MTTGQVLWALLVGLLVAMPGGFITGLKQFIQLKPSAGKPVDSTDCPL